MLRKKICWTEKRDWIKYDYGLARDFAAVSTKFTMNDRMLFATLEQDQEEEKNWKDGMLLLTRRRRTVGREGAGKEKDTSKKS